jgi:hypothetical protein
MANVTPNPPPDDALPNNFNPFKHLQKIYIPQHNALVKRYFSDLPSDWKPNIASSRSSLRVACTMLNSDNELMMQLRHNLLFDILGYGRKDLVILHGSKDPYQPAATGHPKVVFYFTQDSQATPSEETRVEAEYSFRLWNETEESYTPAKALLLAQEVKRLFIQGGKGIVFTKGKNQYKYFHKERGYRLRIYSNSELEATSIIKKLLDLQNVPFDEDKLSVDQPKKSNAITNTTKTIYGKSRKAKNWRPTANVRFRYAFVELPQLNQQIFLIDTTYRNHSLVYP